MLLDTEIRSYKIPGHLWKSGVEEIPGMIPLDMLAKDAMEIELRSQAGVNLKNELRRYTVLCGRMSAIAEDLHGAGLLEEPMIWRSSANSSESAPSARSYLQTMAFAMRWYSFVLNADERDSFYERLCTTYFPPEKAIEHMETFQFMIGHPQIDRLYKKASGESSHLYPPFDISVDDSRNSTSRRYEFLRSVSETESGVIDVLSIASL